MNKGFYKKKALSEKKIARERIEELFKQADLAFPENKGLSNRYVTLARKIAMKCKVRIRPEFKRRFCKHCYKFLMPGTNCRVRMNNGKVVYHCLECKKFMRFPHKKK